MSEKSYLPQYFSTCLVLLSFYERIRIEFGNIPQSMWVCTSTYMYEESVVGQTIKHFTNQLYFLAYMNTTFFLHNSMIRAHSTLVLG